MLPRLTHLQYLTVHLLFAGPQTGKELRRTLRALDIRQSRAAFSRLMSRLVEASYVNPETRTRRIRGHTIRQCRYEVTDLGVADWIAAQKFYVNLAPPSADLVPVATDGGEAAHYDRADRDRAFQQRLVECMHECVDAVRRRPAGFLD